MDHLQGLCGCHCPHSAPPQGPLLPPRLAGAVPRTPPPWKAGNNLDTSSADTTACPEGSLGRACAQPEPRPPQAPWLLREGPVPVTLPLLLGRGLWSAACGGPGEQALGSASLASGPVHMPGPSAGPPATPGIPWGKGRGGELPGTCHQAAGHKKCAVPANFTPNREGVP